jgi:hypothetical protein
MPGSTLGDIQNKVRQLTYSPDPNSLTDAAINQYINTFYVFDFPRHLRTLDKRININILLNSNQQTYDMAAFFTGFPYPQISDLKNYITSIYPPVYVNGQQVQYTQSQTEFYNYYPKFNAQDQIGTGTGAPVIVNNYFLGSGFNLPNNNASVVPGTVNFTAVQADGTSVRNIDNGAGGFIDQNGNPVGGTINYFLALVNGVTLGSPANGANYFVNYLPYTPAQPSIMLWFNNKLSFWPIPDEGYLCTFEADVTFADITNVLQDPEIREWWQYLAYGAAKKVFQDRGDRASVEDIKEEMEEQMNLINRKFITQQSTNRVPTIYCNMDGLGVGNNVNSGNGF